MNPLVSIIIPAYNAERFLAETIQSAIDQTWENKEIIIIDDGSADGTLAVARKFENERIKIFSQANRGASAARNTGLQHAKGDYIQFLDADDLLSKNKIAAQLTEVMACPGYLGLCANVHFLDGTDALSMPAVHEWLAEGSDNPADFLTKLYGGDLIGPQYGGMVAMHAWLTPRSVLDKAGSWDETLTIDDDGEFFCRVALASNGIKYANDAIAYYRKFANQNSLSAQKNYEAGKSLLQSTLLKADYLTAKATDPKAKLALSRLLMDIAFNLYPDFKQLAVIAQKKANELSPGYKHRPFTKGRNASLAAVFGWKLVKQLQHIKQKIN